MQLAEKANEANIIEREMVINNTVIHIKSVFSEQRQLDDALQSIIIRKMSDAKKEMTA